MSKPIDRPTVVADAHLNWLDSVQRMGTINMFGAGRPLQEMFGLDKREASAILSYWMKTFEERSNTDETQA